MASTLCFGICCLQLLRRRKVAGTQPREAGTGTNIGWVATSGSWRACLDHGGWTDFAVWSTWKTGTLSVACSATTDT